MKGGKKVLQSLLIPLELITDGDLETFSVKCVSDQASVKLSPLVGMVGLFKL